ncbi:Non-homologous end joining protein Ku [Bienertia sinuspersici]
MKHAQRLFRDVRSKLKRKYFNDTRLKTKEERLKNKPSEMTKIEWKFLVDHWSDEKFKEKSKKASESRAHQKMPHYNGTKSFARLRQEIRQKNEGKCSRVDVLVASRTRKSKKAVNVLTLEKNTLVVDEIKKLKEQRDQGCAWQRYTWVLESLWTCKIITQHFKVKPSQLDLSQELIEVKKKADQLIEEARKMLKMLEWKLKRPKKKQKPLGMMWIEKLNKTMQFGRRSSINL